MPDADYGEFVAGDEPERPHQPAGYQDLGRSDRVEWDREGHVYVNGRRGCCVRWPGRMWHGLTGGHA